MLEHDWTVTVQFFANAFLFLSITLPIAALILNIGDKK